ncbi:MAG: Crp/Fnr family transcriptional regulator [Solirubrobacterales bacterium]
MNSDGRELPAPGGEGALSESHSLRNFKLFDGLPPSVADDFSQTAHWRRYLPEEMVFDQSSDTLEVHFVFSGRIRLLSCLDNGDTVTLAEVTGGDVFGELAAIDGLPRSARAMATEDALVASIDGASFVQLLERHPQTAVRMLRRLACIIRSMDVRLTNMSSLDPAQRVMVELIRIAEPDTRVPGAWIIPFAPSHAEISGWASVDKEVVARTIGELARDGILRRRGGSIVFLEWPKLQQMAKAKSGRDWERPNGIRDPDQLAEPAAELEAEAS